MPDHVWVKEVLRDLENYARRNDFPTELHSAIAQAHQAAESLMTDGDDNFPSVSPKPML